MAKTLPAPLMTAGTPTVQCVADDRGLAVSPDEHGHVARAHPMGSAVRPVGVAGLDRGRRGQQPDQIGRKVGGDVSRPEAVAT